MHVAVIGTGRWGQNHARALHDLQEDGLVSRLTICDRDRARADEIAGRHDAGAAYDADEIWKGNADAVVIAAPTPAHHPLAKAALEAGKHVLVEKPMTETSDQSRELIELADNKGLVLMPGHIFRYHPCIRDLRRRIQDGELGTIRHLSCIRSEHRAPREDMGVIAALGVHELDLFPYLLGEEVSELVTHRGGHRIDGIEEWCHLHMSFPGGAHAHAYESWLGPAHAKERRLVVAGDKAGATIDMLQSNRYHLSHAVIETGPDGWQSVHHQDEIVALPAGEPLKQELRDFVHCAKEGHIPLATKESGLAAVGWIEQALQPG